MFSRFDTIHACDRRTDRPCQTGRRSCVRICKHIFNTSYKSQVFEQFAHLWAVACRYCVVTITCSLVDAVVLCA